MTSLFLHLVAVGVLFFTYNCDAQCTAPYYRVIVLGNYTSLEGDEFTTECTNQLNENLRSKASLKIPGLNNLLGTELCSRFNADDFTVTTVGTAMKSESTYGGSEVAYIIHPKSHIRIEEVYECGDELNLYLQNFTNWGLPVVPPVSGCPQPFFDPHYFFDGSTTMDWLCLDNVVETERNTDGNLGYVVPESLDRVPPSYSLQIYNDFVTYQQGELDVACTQLYKNDWDAKVLSMMLTVDAKMASGELCPQQAYGLDVYTVTSYLTSQGSDGSISAVFYLQITDDTIRFDDVCNCANEIFTFVEPYESWGLPLLPPPSGCPPLIFDPQEFEHTGETWECLDFSDDDNELALL